MPQIDVLLEDGREFMVENLWTAWDLERVLDIFGDVFECVWDSGGRVSGGNFPS